MTQLRELAGDFTERTAFPAQGTANTDESYAVYTADRRLTVTDARIIFNAALTGQATDYVALQVLNRGPAGAGTGEVTELLAFDNGINAAAFIPVTLNLGADLDLDEGDVLALVRTTPGTGLATPSGLLELDVRNR
jgi:hypothetical protein